MRRRSAWRTLGALAVLPTAGGVGYYLQADFITKRKIRVQFQGVKRFVR